MNQRGKVIVTGGSRGIGAAISKRLAADGYDVIVNFARDEESARVVVEAIKSAGGAAAAIRGDVADAAQIQALFREADGHFGPLVGLVNNAGIIGDARRLDTHDLASITGVFAVNVIGAMLCAKEAVLRLSTRTGGPGGSIVSISSVAARLGGIPGMVAYSASKGAIESFTRAMANEVSREGIRVNAVAPGMIETDMTRDVAAQVAPMIPMGRVGQPDEIAAAVAWLMSPDASYVTGTTMTVSGGR